MQLIQLLSKMRVEEGKDKLIPAILVGFQLGSGGDKTFGEYLSYWGLSNEPPQSIRSQDEENDADILRYMGVDVRVEGKA